MNEIVASAQRQRFHRAVHSLLQSRNARSNVVDNLLAAVHALKDLGDTDNEYLLSSSSLEPLTARLLDLAADDEQPDQATITQLSIVLLTYLCKFCAHATLSHTHSETTSPNLSLSQRCWQRLFSLASTTKNAEVASLVKYFYFAVGGIGLSNDADSSSNPLKILDWVSSEAVDVSTCVTESQSRRALLDIGVVVRVFAYLFRPPQIGTSSGLTAAVKAATLQRVAVKLYQTLRVTLPRGRPTEINDELRKQRKNGCSLLDMPLVFILRPNTVSSGQGFMKSVTRMQSTSDLFAAPAWEIAADELNCNLLRLMGNCDEVIAADVFPDDGAVHQAKRPRLRQTSSSRTKAKQKFLVMLQAIVGACVTPPVNNDNDNVTTSDDDNSKVTRASSLIRCIGIWKCVVGLLGPRLCVPLSSSRAAKAGPSADSTASTYAKRCVTAMLQPLNPLTRFLKSGDVSPTRHNPIGTIGVLCAALHMMAAWQVGSSRKYATV